MAGLTVKDTRLGRETLRNQFISTVYDLADLKPGEGYDMRLFKHGEEITLRYVKTEGAR
jgi:hypothetical protein